MPSVVPELGNLVVSVTQRPLASTFGPWLPGHWYQKSSRLMFVYPSAGSPLFFIASACASILAAVGFLRMKLQLLQPSAGVRPTPLFSAWAEGALTNATPARASRPAEARLPIRVLRVVARMMLSDDG